MSKEAMIQCHGCKSWFIFRDEDECYRSAGIGRYGVASPACLAAFSAVLAKEIELFGYPPAHRLIVDAYAVQHPPIQELQKSNAIDSRLIEASIQSIGIHLIALYLAIEKNVPLSEIARVMDSVLTAMNKERATFQELPAPAMLGSMTVIDVKDAFLSKDYTLQEYTQLAYSWAYSTWQAWSAYHTTVEGWYKTYSGKLDKGV